METSVIGFEIAESKVMELAPIEYKSFIDTIEELDLDLETVASAFVASNSESIEFFWNDTENKNNMSCEDAYSMLTDKFNELSDAIFSKTNIVLELYVPVGNTNSEADRVYWTIENAYIRNEAISPEYVSYDTRYSFNEFD